ncbi:MAG: hypothetical protein JOZ44_19895, partial [Acidobacteria bacterium]|nr:hypothetical protein [Acidobacteriota bacterium]
MLEPAAKLKVIQRIKRLVMKHHFSVQNVDLAAWCKDVDDHIGFLIEASGDKSFEERVHQFLSKLKSSHTDFYRADRNPIRPEHAIGATLRSVNFCQAERWMFLNVFEDGPAACAGVIPGQLLLSVDGVPITPPEVPTFAFGVKQNLTIGLPNNNQQTWTATVTIPPMKSTKPRLPFVEPKSISFRILSADVGLLKVAFFPGMLGIRFSGILDAAIETLKSQGCTRLVVDLRGCLGGSLGFARLASYMCPDRIPIGYDVTRRRQRRGYDVTELPRVRMPNTRLGALYRLAQFSLRDKSLVLLTQGLGKQPFHGKIVVLINECTSSAAEMLAQFAKDTKTATIVGQKSAGLVLGSALFDLGYGYKLYLPVFGWYTPRGGHTEGSGVTPDIEVDVDP